MLDLYRRDSISYQLPVNNNNELFPVIICSYYSISLQQTYYIKEVSVIAAFMQTIDDADNCLDVFNICLPHRFDRHAWGALSKGSGLSGPACTVTPLIKEEHNKIVIHKSE